MGVVCSDCGSCDTATGGRVNPAAFPGSVGEHGAEQLHSLPPHCSGDPHHTAHHTPASVSTYTHTHTQTQWTHTPPLTHMHTTTHRHTHMAVFQTSVSNTKILATVPDYSATKITHFGTQRSDFRS